MTTHTHTHTTCDPLTTCYVWETIRTIGTGEVGLGVSIATAQTSIIITSKIIITTTRKLRQLLHPEVSDDRKRQETWWQRIKNKMHFLHSFLPYLQKCSVTNTAYEIVVAELSTCHYGVTVGHVTHRPPTTVQVDLHKPRTITTSLHETYLAIVRVPVSALACCNRVTFEYVRKC